MEQIYFVLTERCNLSCSHCIRESSPLRSEVAELNIVKNTLDDIAVFYPKATILLSGGEPTIYKNFMSVLEYALYLKLDVIINSNGTTSFFNKNNLIKLSKHKNLIFQISLDGVETIHDLIRGNDMYRKALRTIDYLRSCNIKCTVSATAINKDFFKDIEVFIEDIDKKGLRHIAIKRLTYAGRAADGSDLDTNTWNKQVYRIRAMVTKTPIIINPMYDFSILDKIDDVTLRAITPNPSTINCGAGIAKIYIYPSGDVCSCTCFRDLPIGNLNIVGLKNIIDSYKELQIDQDSCGNCRYISLCRGGCLGSGYKYTGRLGQPDPRCPRTENISKIIKINRSYDK